MVRKETRDERKNKTAADRGSTRMDADRRGSTRIDADRRGSTRIDADERR